MDDARELTAEELSHFMKQPEVLPIYAAFAQRVMTDYPDATITVMKTTVAFTSGHRFAYAGLPMRRMKDWPKVCIVVTFMLDWQVESPRVAASVSPYPNRWTHHVVVADPAEIDDELMGFIALSYDFAHRKGRRRS